MGGTVGGVALIAIIIGGLFFWRRRKRAASPEANAEAQGQGWRKAELSGDGVEKPPPSHELDAMTYHELPGGENLISAELDATTPRNAEVSGHR